MNKKSGSGINSEKKKQIKQYNMLCTQNISYFLLTTVYFFSLP